MAAFEAVSKILVKTVGSTVEFVDVRITNLPEETPPITDFDPRDYREPSNPISPWMAYFNLMKASFGAGMLAMPMAISQVGVILGPVMTILVGILLTHTHMMMLKCLNEISRQLKIPYISYRYGFRMGLLHGPPILHFWGRSGPTLIAVFMVMSQLSICTVFVILTTDNLRDIMDWPTSEPALLALLLPYILLEIFMKNLKIVSYVSMGGNLLNIIALLLVHIIMLRDPRKEVTYGQKDLMPLFVAYGIMLFNHSAVGVILSCEKALRNPKIMGSKLFSTSVVSVGIMFPALMSSIFGTLGYWCYGKMEENILRYVPYDDFLSLLCFAFYLISVALTYPLQCYPGIQILLEVIKNHDPRVVPRTAVLKSVEYFSRPVFVATTFLIAYFIPFQGPFVAFVGNLCTNILAVVFPALMEIGLLYPDRYGSYDYILVKDLLLVFLGLVSWFTGIGHCGYLIYIRIQSLRSPNLSVADL